MNSVKIFYCLIMIIWNNSIFCVAAMEIVDQGLKIASSLKTLFQDPPKIDMNDYLSDQEKDYRNKIILEDFERYYTLENKNFRDIDFKVKGKKKFLWWTTNPGDSSEINRLHDMIDKVKNILPLYGVAYSKNNNNYPRGIDGFVMSIQDCLQNISLKRSVYTFNVMQNTFYRDNMDIILDFESEQLVGEADILNYKNLEENLEKDLLQLKVMHEAVANASSKQYLMLINLLIDLDSYVKYKTDFLARESVQFTNLIKEIEVVYRSLLNTLDNKNDVFNDEKNKNYKFLFGDTVQKDQRIKDITNEIVNNLF